MPGRPTKYKAEYAKQAAKLCKLGATNYELAEFFEVAISTINLWAVKHKPFSDSLKIGKDDYDERVVRSLALSAIGYSCEETKVQVCDGVPVETTIIKHFPPNPVAAKMWLTCRQREEWAPVAGDPDDDVPAPTKVEIVVKDARIRDDEA